VKMDTGAVSSMSRLQSIIALSTTEAEFISAIFAGQEIVWMRSFLGELGYSFDAPSLLLVDNQSAIQVARNPEHHGRMKHLDLRFFWLRKMVNSGLIAVRRTTSHRGHDHGSAYQGAGSRQGRGRLAPTGSDSALSSSRRQDQEGVLV
jgi:hypothetical protein